MKKIHIRFVINPKSGKKRKDRVPDLIQKFLDDELFTYDIKHTEYRAHGIKLAEEAIADKVDIICAVGGDGSVHEIGKTIINSDVKLAILPMGSGNGLARHVKIPLKLKKAIRCINDNNYFPIDTVSINNHQFLGVAGMGIDAIIADRFDSHKTRGLRGYVSVVFKEYFKYKPLMIETEIDGVTKRDKLFICSIANSSEFGNGFCISPNSKINDGKIELFKLRKIRFYDVPFVAYKFFTRSIHKSRYAEIIPFTEAIIRCEKDIMHLDGEPVTVKSPLHIKVNPKSLHILVGRKKKKHNEFHRTKS